MANKNSLYIQSLVSFILDTKPYHSKLTEINEIYQFSDSMTVHFDEKMYSTVLTKAAWPYSYFSGGPGILPAVPVHRMVSPQFRGVNDNLGVYNIGQFRVGRDENVDLPLVPNAYDPKSIQGIGLSDAGVQRAGVRSSAESMIEGHDVFLSHGAYVFQIKQVISTQPKVVGVYEKEYTVTDGPYPVTVQLPFTADSLLSTGPVVELSLTQVQITGPGIVKVNGLSDDPNYSPMFTERKNEDVLAHATAVAQAQALDSSKPSSAINKIRALLALVGTQLVAQPSSLAQNELNALLDQLNGSSPSLPNSYEALINALIGAGVLAPPGYVGWRGADTTVPYTDKYFEADLSALSTSLYFNNYTDIGQRENGALNYYNTTDGITTVSDIAVDVYRPDYEEWTLTAENASTYTLSGSITGVVASIFVGSVNVTQTFSSPQISFKISRSDNAVEGAKLTFSPYAKVTVHAQAPAEGWSLIKVNPMAYSRPVFNSTRYGYVASATNAIGQVTILDQTIPTSTITLTATTPTSFSVKSSAIPSYSGTATVGQLFNDGIISFRIMAGSAFPFEIGDKFFIEIENDPAIAEELDLYYGFDMGPYDANELVYNNVNSAVQDYLTTLDFNYDSRFANYDLASFGLVVSQAAVDGRQWRLRALPNFLQPLLLQNSSPSNFVNELGVDNPNEPNGTLQFDMDDDVTSEGPQSATDPDSFPDIRLWYASSFALEFFYNGIWNAADTIQVGVPYSSALYGFTFTIVPAAKPFIASRLHSSWFPAVTGAYQEEEVDGGDVITWTVRNNAPVQSEPASLASTRTPRLWMHGDSFHNTVPATWEMNFTSPTDYTIQGVYTEGTLANTTVFTTPYAVSLNDDVSFRNNSFGVHYSVKQGRGLGSGDNFKFTTYSDKPSYLVHGTVSGWQPDATVGKYYWNGKIGFTIKEPEARLFAGGGIVTDWSVTGISITRLRFDTPSMVYLLRALNNNHWTLYRNGRVVSTGQSSVSDEYITLALPNLATAGTLYTIDITGDDHDLVQGHDLAVVRASGGRMPNASDFMVFERTERDALQISIKPKDPAHGLVLAPLAPVTTDIRFVDITAGSGVDLDVTSPETSVLQGWLPTLLEYRDTATSTAHFSDPATHVVLTAAATGELIGTVSPVLDDPDTSVFRWDEAFHTKYMPLNAEATIVTLGSGMDDRVVANMTEGIYFLVSGGGLLNDALFRDSFTAHIVGDNQWFIKQNEVGQMQVTMADTGFTGFLPGYDTHPYDFEVGDGDIEGEGGASYDQGVPLTEYYDAAQALRQIVRTQAQEETYQTLLGELNPFLNDGTLENTTFQQFIANFDAESARNIGVPGRAGFGIPDVGLGISIEDRQKNNLGASVIEAMIIVANDFGYEYDQFGYDVGPLDTPSESTAIVFSSSLAPIPLTGLPPAGTAYDAFETPLFIEGAGARVVELSFSQAATAIPDVYIWRPDDTEPRRVPIVERLTSRLFRFSLPAAVELKVVLG